MSYAFYLALISLLGGVVCDVIFKNNLGMFFCFGLIWIWSWLNVFQFERNQLEFYQATIFVGKIAGKFLTLNTY